MHRVFVTRTLPGDGTARLAAAGFEVIVHNNERPLGRAQLLRKVSDADALVTLFTDKIDRQVLRAAKRLQIVANCGVGYDHIDIREATKRGIAVTNTPDVSAETVAEYALLLMSALGRKLLFADAFVRKGNYKGWKPGVLLGTELYKNSLGIVGLGQIGKHLAHFARRAFAMDVYYYDIVRDRNFEKRYGLRYDRLPTLLKNCRFVSLHTPLLPQTRHLLGAKEFAGMRPDAFLVNTARGPVVDEKALYEALRHKQIAGAALDVFEFEPRVTAGFKKLSNVIVTPHIASYTHETRARMSEVVAENVIAKLSGKRPPHLVN